MPRSASIITAHDQPRRRNGIVSQEADGELVLLDVVGGTYFSLNEVGGRVWALSDGGRQVSDIVTALCGEFDAEPETVIADVIELLAELVSERLVELGP